MQAHPLVHYQNYTRKEVHDVFDPTSTFTPQAGTWGLQGIIEIPQRPRDFVFFVTFGKSQAAHAFDEGITVDGVLRWQSHGPSVESEVSGFAASVERETSRSQSAISRNRIAQRAALSHNVGLRASK
jgi:hypothetical protein